MKTKPTKPVERDVEFVTAMKIDDVTFSEGDIVTIKYNKGDDILTATGRIAFIGAYGGFTGPYLRLDCSDKWHSENVIVESNDILGCEFYGGEEVE